VASSLIDPNILGPALQLRGYRSLPPGFGACPACRAYGWDMPRQQPVLVSGTVHHPACPVVRAAVARRARVSGLGDLPSKASEAAFAASVKHPEAVVQEGFPPGPREGGGVRYPAASNKARVDDATAIQAALKAVQARPKIAALPLPAQRMILAVGLLESGFGLGSSWWVVRPGDSGAKVVPSFNWGAAHAADGADSFPHFDPDAGAIVDHGVYSSLDDGLAAFMRVWTNGKNDTIAPASKNDFLEVAKAMCLNGYFGDYCSSATSATDSAALARDKAKIQDYAGALQSSANFIERTLNPPSEEETSGTTLLLGVGVAAAIVAYLFHTSHPSV